MQSLVICSAPADSAAAHEIRHYLEVNLPRIALQNDAIIPSPGEVLDTVDGALSADLVLLLLSPDSVPTGWMRSQWEPVLIEQPRQFATAVAFLQVRPCRFPEIFRREKFFDLHSDQRTGLRKLKQWLLDQNPLKQERINVLPPRRDTPVASTGVTPSDLQSLLDHPGTLIEADRALVLEFAHAHERDFEGAFWIDCSRRSRAGIIGDTAHALGLRLSGPLAQNTAALHQFCSERRCLFVFEGLCGEDHETVAFEGRPSVIFTRAPAEPRGMLSFVDTVELFARWRRHPDRCQAHLGDAARHLEILKKNPSAATAGLAGSLASSVLALLREESRLAEAYELLQFLSDVAWEQGSVADLRHWEWEKGWIREAWGDSRSIPLRIGVTGEPEQLGLAF